MQSLKNAGAFMIGLVAGVFSVWPIAVWSIKYRDAHRKPKPFGTYKRSLGY